MASEINSLLCRLCSRGQRKGTVCQVWRGPVRGALFRGISRKSKFVIYHPLCDYSVSW
jgi:hypothetical protein